MPSPQPHRTTPAETPQCFDKNGAVYPHERCSVSTLTLRCIFRHDAKWQEEQAGLAEAQKRLEYWKEVKAESERMQGMQNTPASTAEEKKEQEDNRNGQAETGTVLGESEVTPYKLSEEVDENGRQFVLSPSGSLEFGVIEESSGLSPAPILLSEGLITNPATNDGYGLIHIEARHGEQIRNAGYKSVLSFIEEVAKNYEVIKEGINRNGNQTYMLQLTDKHNNTLMVELSGDGTYWNINTAGIFKTSYGKNRKEVYNRHTTTKRFAEIAEASQDVEQSGTQTSSSMIAPTSSASKDTTSSVTSNNLEEKNAGDVDLQNKRKEIITKIAKNSSKIRRIFGAAKNDPVERFRPAVTMHPDDVYDYYEVRVNDGQLERLERLFEERDALKAELKEIDSKIAMRKQSEAPKVESPSEVENDNFIPYEEQMKLRIEQWEKALGVKVVVYTDYSQVKSRTVRAEWAKGEQTPGWYDTGTNTAYIFLPHNNGVKSIDETFVHEAVSHKGVKEMLGEENFNKFLDGVWNMMSEKARKEYLGYVRGSADNTENRRAAADEYVAHLSEGMSGKFGKGLSSSEKGVWNKIVDFFRDLFASENQDLADAILDKKVLTDNDIKQMIAQSFTSLRDKAEELSRPIQETNDTDDLLEYAKRDAERREMLRKVYHGSGASFDKFDHSHMGEGEGAQAFGWGTYVTDVKDIGRTYAIATAKPLLTYKGETVDTESFNSPWRIIKDLYDENNGRLRDMRARAERIASLVEDDNAEMKGLWGEVNNLLKNVRSGDLKIAQSRNLYEVEIPDDNGSNYLHWDKDVPKKVKDDVKRSLFNVLVEGDYKGAEKELKRELDDLFALDMDGGQLYGNVSAYLGSDKEASQFFNSIGFVGISYPAEFTSGGRSDGARNYVIFNEKDLEIQERTRFRKRLKEVNDKFNKTLGTYTEENADKIVFDLGSPSDILLSAGVANKRMKLYGSKVKRKIAKHKFSASDLQDLPMHVAYPIAVFDNYNEEYNRSILTELRTEQGNFLVTLSVGKGQDIDFNIISSVFGKGDDNVVNWLNKGYATYIDKTKALNYLHLVTPIVTASNNQELDSATKVIEEFVNPKLSEEKPLFRKKKDSNNSVSSVTDAASEEDLEKKGIVAENEEEGQIMFSKRTYEESGRDSLKDFVGKQVGKGALTQEQADEIVAQMEEIYEVCSKYEGVYAPFGAWSNAEVEVGKDGVPVFSVIKQNGDYGMNLDFSLVCKKRRTLDAVLGELINRGLINKFMYDGVQIAQINDIIRKHGFETACRLCFVDSKRFRVFAVADKFVSMYNSLVGMTDKQLQKIVDTTKKETVRKKAARHLLENPEDRIKVGRENFVNSDGFEDVAIDRPEILKLYNMSKGSGGPKASFGDVQYLNDIQNTTWTPEKAYSVGGVRLQSFSDYVPRMVLDYVQMLADLASKRLPVHAYTKEPIFAKQFGLSGIKINLSLVPRVDADGFAPGLDKDGNYAWQEGETFPYEEAVALQNAEGYKENCGTIAVGVSDEHIEKLLNDENIRMVIPYHKSGLNKQVAIKNNIDKFKDYTSEQNTRKGGSKVGKEGLNGMPDFNALVHEGMHPREAAQAYLDWCDSKGYTPKFDKFRENPNYYKLLEDFTTVITENGAETLAPQRSVEMRFPSETDAFGSMETLIKEGLEEDAVLEGKRQSEVGNIVDEIVETLGDKQVMFRFIGKKGAENLDKAEEASTRLDNLNVAREMEDAGKDAKAIKMATGWERGADGLWRYEVEDNITFDKDGNVDFGKRHPGVMEEYKRYKALLHKKNALAFDGKELSEEEQKEFDALAPIWKGSKLQFSSKLKDYVDAPELFAAYPELADAKLKFRDDISANGYYDKEKNEIGVSRSVSNYRIKEVLVHEIQHAIQFIEGFGEGGNLMTSQPLIKEIVELAGKGAETASLDTIAQAFEEGYIPKERTAEAQRIAEEHGYSDLGKYIRSLNAYGYYRRLGGEVESRNVQKRMNMPIAERRASLASETEDVAREDQIILKQGLGLNYVQDMNDTDDLVEYAKRDVERRNAKNLDADGVRLRKVTDPKKIAELEASEKQIGYRNVVLNEDGTFGSPMASSLRRKGVKTTKTEGFALNEWEEAEENLDLADENGKITLVKPDGKTVDKVDYNPYIHNRLDKVNSQFKQAWERPNLVYIETEVPVTDLESGYHAEKAAKPVGIHKWNGGDLMLSRYDKPVRIVPWEEVADDWVKRFAKRGVEFDIVPPALRPILVERGVEILPPHKGMGEDCNNAYKEWKKEKGSADSRTSASNSERSGAVSGNSSSKGLLHESSGHLSRYSLASQEDIAKLQKNSKETLSSARKTINEGGLKDLKTVERAVRAVSKGLKLIKSKSSQSYYGELYEGEFEVDGKTLKLRVSTHPANGARIGNDKAEDKISIVVRKNGEHVSTGEHNGYTEYVYEPSEVALDDAANAILKGVVNLITNGEFTDETGKAHVQSYPYADSEGNTYFRKTSAGFDAVAYAQQKVKERAERK